MANDQVVGVSLQVNASSSDAANKSITELKSNVKDLKKAFEDSKAGSTEQAEAFKKLTAAQDDLAKSTSTLNKTSEETTGHFKNIQEGVGSLGGPLGEASEGVTKLNSTFVKLLANPVVLIIGAIVAVLALLYKAFTNSFEGGEKMEQVFAGIKAAGQALLDNLGKIGSAIVKFFTFDFSGALADIKGVVSAAVDGYSQMAKLTAKAQELHKEQLANDLDQAKRAKDLAILREQASDETIPIAKRKAALLELQKAAKDDAVKDIALAKEVTDNKIAQLTLQKDGALKNMDEINKARVEQINGETESANEQRRIAKQITLANKQELAERKEAATAAAEEAKKRRQELVDFTNKLAKIQQDNELAVITDSYEKEKKVLENKIADDKRQNDLAFQDKKITQAQYDQINAALTTQANLQLAALQDKHNKDVADKDAAFQKDLAAIRGKTQTDGITDARAAERVQLEITHQQQLADAIKNYKDDAVKLQTIKQALDEQLRAEQAKLDAKYKAEDDKKAFKTKSDADKLIIQNKKIDYDKRLAAIADDQKLTDQAFANKVISEQEYNDQTAQLAQDRMTIRDEERKHNEQVTNAIGDAFSTLSDLAGKQTVAGKALAIASTTIKTFQSAVSAFEGMVSEIPGPIGIALGVVAAAGAIATGLDAVKKIVAVQIPGQGDAGGSVPTAPLAMTAPVAPTQQSTSLNQSSIDSIGDATSGRAYVLDADVQNNADRNARLNRAARLGG